MDWKEAAGVIIGGVALLLPAVKWLISDWAKKAEEIETLKKKNSDLSFKRFEQDLFEFRGTVSALQKEIREHGEKIIGHSSKLASLEEKLAESKLIIEKHSQNLEGNVRNLIRTELVTLSKEAQLIRDKKNGK